MEWSSNSQRLAIRYFQLQIAWHLSSTNERRSSHLSRRSGLGSHPYILGDRIARDVRSNNEKRTYIIWNVLSEISIRRRIRCAGTHSKSQIIRVKIEVLEILKSRDAVGRWRLTFHVFYRSHLKWQRREYCSNCTRSVWQSRSVEEVGRSWRKPNEVVCGHVRKCPSAISWWGVSGWSHWLAQMSKCQRGRKETSRHVSNNIALISRIPYFHSYEGQPHLGWPV